MHLRKHKLPTESNETYVIDVNVPYVFLKF